MSSVVLNRAAEVKAPFGNDLDLPNQFGVYKTAGGLLTTETTHFASQVPFKLRGKWAEIYVTGGDLYYAFTTISTAEIDRAAATAQGLITDKIGAVIPNGESRHVFIPDPEAPNAQTAAGLYFVRESSAVGTVVYIRIASP